MKVIKMPAEATEIWKVAVKCEGDKLSKTKGCGAELEITEEDLKPFCWKGTHSFHTYLSARCPVCGAILQNVNDKVTDYMFKKWRKNHPKALGEFDGFHDGPLD